MESLQKYEIMKKQHSKAMEEFLALSDKEKEKNQKTRTILLFSAPVAPRGSSRYGRIFALKTPIYLLLISGDSLLISHFDVRRHSITVFDEKNKKIKMSIFFDKMVLVSTHYPKFNLPLNFKESMNQ